MKHDETLAGFPAVSSEIESLQQELRDVFRLAKPVMIGIAAFCMAQTCCILILG